MTTAVDNNNARILKSILKVPQLIPKKDFTTGVKSAIKLGHTECLDCLLTTDIINVNERDSCGQTLVYHAVQSNRHSAVECLIKYGAKVNMGGHTPLHIAAHYGYDECAKVLLQHSAQINAQNSLGNTPLIVASIYKQVQIIRMLIESGCDVNIQNSEGRTALHFCSQKAMGVNILLAAGADPNIVDKDSISPLLTASTEGFDKVIHALVAAGGDVNIANEPFKRTPLHILSLKGHTDCLKDLIYGGAEIDMYDSLNRTPLWYAIYNKHFDIVKLLLRANCHVDSYKCADFVEESSCPTRLAMSMGLVNVIKLFILTGYDKEHVKQCLPQSEIQEQLNSDEEYFSWVDHANDVASLKQTCRKWVRHHLGRHLYHVVYQLPIPQVMKDFVFLTEIDEAH